MKVEIGIKLAVSLGSVFAIAFLTSCHRDWNEQESKVKKLVETRATKEQLVALLGERYIDYSEGSTNRAALMEFLVSESKDRLVDVRDKVKKHPNLLFYSTPDMMTWVFLSKSNIVMDFSMNAQ